MHKLNQLEQAVLVIDDLQVLLENSVSGKASTLINILSAQISEGAANLVLTLTNDSYRKNIEKHPIEGRLDIIKIEELDTATLESAIQLHKKRIENYYELRISDACIKDSIALSKRYFKERSLPSAPSTCLTEPLLPSGYAIRMHEPVYLIWKRILRK